MIRVTCIASMLYIENAIHRKDYVYHVYVIVNTLINYLYYIGKAQDQCAGKHTGRPGRSEAEL